MKNLVDFIRCVLGVEERPKRPTLNEWIELTGWKSDTNAHGCITWKEI